MRIRRYERFCGFYLELVKHSCYNFKPDEKDKAFTMNPEAVWYAIEKDETGINVEESNHSQFEEQEIVVFRVLADVVLVQ